MEPENFLIIYRTFLFSYSLSICKYLKILQEFLDICSIKLVKVWNEKASEASRY